MRANNPDVSFRQSDLVRYSAKLFGFISSLSCLHAQEHSGLDRYGDSICKDGHLVGGRDIASLLATDGNLILSYLMGGHRVDLDSQRALDRVRIVDVDRGLGLQPKSPVTCEPEGLLEEIKMLLGR